MTYQCMALDNPSCTITAKGSDDTEVTIQIGSLLTAIIQTIMQVEGSDDIYTIASSYVSDISSKYFSCSKRKLNNHHQHIHHRCTAKTTALIDMKRSYTRTGNRGRDRPKTHPRKQKREVKYIRSRQRKLTQIQKKD